MTSSSLPTPPVTNIVSGRSYVCNDCNCTSKAVWVIKWGNEKDEYTLACNQHLPSLIGDSMVIVWPLDSKQGA
jgi:hypothetical protein